MKRTRILDLPTCKEGSEVQISGWVDGVRALGKIAFLSIRDGTGTVQAVAKPTTSGWDLVEELSLETAISLRGILKKDERALGGVEIKATQLSIIAPSAPDYPIQPKEHSTGFLMSQRHLWIRRPLQASLLRIRSTVILAAQNHLDSLGYVRVDAPILTPTSCEGTTTLFKLDYFEKTAYLTQSGQLYNEATAHALDRVYCFGPTFRAEKSKTRKHLTEFWMLEPEAVGLGLEENISLQESLFCALIDGVLDAHEEELERRFKRDLRALKICQRPFPRMTFAEASSRLSSLGFPLDEEGDFGAQHEEELAKDVGRPFFVHHFPAAAKAFYMAPDPLDPSLSLSLDLIAPDGGGEITGGGVRIQDPNLLARRMDEEGLNRDDFSWYTDLRKYGGVQTGGFGMGIERMVRWLTGTHHVRETIPFPRTIDRLSP
ncbi:asparagine--tRNA ligase [bacterium]|nr:asparagine--tRNA ligase [bacterium]